MENSGESFQINEPSIVSETIDGEVVIINLDQGSYYSLRGSAAEIWARLQEGQGAGALRQYLGQLYDGDAAEMDVALSGFLDQLQAEEILRSVSEGTQASAVTAAAAAVPPDGKAPFVAPLLEKFTDMEHLLLLDPIHEVDDAGWPNLK
jgi:hypothetical protein